MDFIQFFFQAFFSKVWPIAIVISVLILISAFSLYFSLQNKRLNAWSQFAPTILTTAGLLGTFIGLTIGLQQLKSTADGGLDPASFGGLVEGLKAVFVYALSGVAASLLFMGLNTRVAKKQAEQQQLKSEQLKDNAQRHNNELLTLQRNQEKSLQALAVLQNKQLESQKVMQETISKLQFDNDNQQLASLISQGVVQGLNPLLLEIKTAVADQGTEAIKQVLEDLKQEILVPMNGALNHTNTALKETTDAVKATVDAIKASQEHNGKLIVAVGEAAIKMEDASEKMNGLVDKIDKTVQHMDNIQIAQKASLDSFNQELQTNLATIKPAIQEGLDAAKVALTGAIGSAAALMTTSIADASKAMQDNIKTVLNDSGTELKSAVTQATQQLSDSVTKTIATQNESINDSFKKFDTIQHGLNTILNDFSQDMNGHLDRMATELEQIGTNSKNLIDTASTNLKETLGDIDDKLLNTAKVLEASLEKFRIQYQTSLTTYLEQQTQNLDGFLDRQNQQLEQTIGKQRQGLEDVTNSLTKQFGLMDEKQKEINDAHTKLIKVIDSAGISILPKVESIARELNQGEKKLSQGLERSSEHLDKVSHALEALGQNLPPAFEKAFQQLNENYKESFTDLDRGLKDAVNGLGTTVGALTQAISLHDAVTH